MPNQVPPRVQSTSPAADPERGAARAPQTMTPTARVQKIVRLEQEQAVFEANTERQIDALGDKLDFASISLQNSAGAQRQLEIIEGFGRPLTPDEEKLRTLSAKIPHLARAVTLARKERTQFRDRAQEHSDKLSRFIAQEYASLVEGVTGLPKDLAEKIAREAGHPLSRSK